MRTMLTVTRRELVAYFSTPLAYVFMVAFLAAAGAAPFYLGQFIERHQADLTPFFSSHPWLFLVLIPLVQSEVTLAARRIPDLLSQGIARVSPWLEQQFGITIALDMASLKALVASLRFADAGYSGVFDQAKIREAELDRIYAHDLGLVESVERTAALVRGGDVAAATAEVDALAREVARRKTLFEGTE